jgi:eukaryotic-like serine/threonine-protein kinase
MIGSTTAHDLLLGLVALQNGLVNQGQLVAAFQAWTLDKSRSLAEHMQAQGDLPDARRALVEALAAVHLDTHGGDAHESIAAAVLAGESTREGLAKLGDPEIEATLAHFGESHRSTEGVDADCTTSYADGAKSPAGKRFRVLRPHAKGGLGAVFVALDCELHREVALKQILDHNADDPICRQRFLLEAEITAGLEHPGIVPVYGLGSDGDGRPYYAMRFIKGDSLKEAIEHFHSDEALKKDPSARSLELRKLLRRLINVCDAIGYAHSRGVLHRDIKPSNVIVGKHGETLLVDWGLAKATGRSDPAAGERTLLPSSGSGSAETLPGAALGTPAYMSPEQAAGDLDSLGPPSDVYGLGATLYCLLTGKPPFAGEVADVLRAVQKGDFRLPRTFDPTIDRGLEMVCLKAMACEPAERYATPKALAEDIERWMADEPLAAWPEPISRRVFRWSRRHRLAVFASAACLFTAIIACWAASVVFEQQRSRIERGRQIAADYETAGEALVELLDVVVNRPEQGPAGALPDDPQADSTTLLSAPNFVKPSKASDALRGRLEEVKSGLESRGQHRMAMRIDQIIKRFNEGFGITPEMLGD